MLTIILSLIVVVCAYRVIVSYLTNATCNDGSYYGGYKHWARWALFVVVGYLVVPTGEETLEGLLYILTCMVVELSLLVPRRFRLFYFSKSFK